MVFPGFYVWFDIQNIHTNKEFPWTPQKPSIQVAHSQVLQALKQVNACNPTGPKTVFCPQS